MKGERSHTAFAVEHFEEKHFRASHLAQVVPSVNVGIVAGHRVGRGVGGASSDFETMHILVNLDRTIVTDSQWTVRDWMRTYRAPHIEQLPSMFHRLLGSFFAKQVLYPRVGTRWIDVDVRIEERIAVILVEVLERTWPTSSTEDMMIEDHTRGIQMLFEEITHLLVMCLFRSTAIVKLRLDGPVVVQYFERTRVEIEVGLLASQVVNRHVGQVRCYIRVYVEFRWILLKPWWAAVRRLSQIVDSSKYVITHS